MLKREEIINRMAEKGYTKKSANLIVDDFVRVIAEALAAGEDVQFHGFGTFCVRNVANRETTDLQTKERITIPGHKAPKFVPSKALKRWVREGIVRD